MSEPIEDYDLDEDEPPETCDYCGRELDVVDGVCRECRFAGCIDDMCHGIGYCVHEWKVQP